ncbi:MAG: phosphoribosylamine--glycine ligase [Solibacterales bacterium]|nr:phosphoribosylamine--glycine ligase [Bryobacterales bacterium]|tara:strand:- start:8558 stop:9829 length:1272 start_codon:yes stop_codon:yes gene_type:complete
MKVLVVGGGGREHAFCWRLGRSDSVEQVYAVPGNAGIAQEHRCFSQDIKLNTEILALAQHLDVDLTVIGPEAPLVAGLADKFRMHGLSVIGPGAEAAQLEGSKIFSKQFMKRHGIPTADFAVVESMSELEANLTRFGFPVALKADGLAAGKGVIIVRDEDEARETGTAMLSGEVVGDAGKRLLIEQFMTGEEVSFIVLSDGKTFFEFPPSQDHKPIFDNDLGPNTGGMGAYCDPRILSTEERQVILTTIVENTLDGIRSDGYPFVGFLYFGLMMTENGPQVLEYNVRMGDPETQPLMYRMTGDAGELLLSAARGNLNPKTVGWDEGPTCCIVCAAPGYPSSYPQGLPIAGVDEAEATGAKVFHAGTALQEGNLVTAGGRVLGVTAGGQNLASAIGNAYAAAEKIQFDGLHYRKDIGQKGLCRW